MSGRFGADGLPLLAFSGAGLGNVAGPLGESLDLMKHEFFRHPLRLSALAAPRNPRVDRFCLRPQFFFKSVARTAGSGESRTPDLSSDLAQSTTVKVVSSKNCLAVKLVPAAPRARRACALGVVASQWVLALAVSSLDTIAGACLHVGTPHSRKYLDAGLPRTMRSFKYVGNECDRSGFTQRRWLKSRRSRGMLLVKSASICSRQLPVADTFGWYFAARGRCGCITFPRSGRQVNTLGCWVACPWWCVSSSLVLAHWSPFDFCRGLDDAGAMTLVCGPALLRASSCSFMVVRWTT